MKRELHTICASLKKDRDLRRAPISRDLRMVAVTAVRASAAGASPLLRKRDPVVPRVTVDLQLPVRNLDVYADSAPQG
ncbi:MAG TPA: hypothetical protein VF169_15065 [Albitalea sp.]|uniref:hypothetical protein n=1 Tax=Piscinibacter sp. TaxID=1903157 RepID=UPI002ED3FBE1